jgi:membrane protein DedA with SNARE-associated domain
MLAAPDIPRVVLVTLLTVAGLVIAYCINFAFGKYGWYRFLLALGLREPLARAQRRLTRHGLIAVFATYWQFSVASISSTAAGVLQFPFGRFLAYSAGGALVWMTFWSTLIYFLGRAALGLVGIPFLVGFIAIWLIVQIVGGFLRRRTKDDGGM